MLKTLEGMSGVKHEAKADSKSITENASEAFELTRVEGKLTRNISVKEEAVIKYNDLAFIPACNAIIFRAGRSPIWNRNEHAMPMAWRLHMTVPVHPGYKYNLNTLPSMSTARDFDVRKNKPDFNEWFDKRLDRAAKVAEAVDLYKELHGYDDRDIELLDPDIYAADVMSLVGMLLNPVTVREDGEVITEFDMDPDELELMMQREQERVAKEVRLSAHATDHEENIKAMQDAENEESYYSDEVFGKGISRGLFYNRGKASRSFDKEIIEWFTQKSNWAFIYDDPMFGLFKDGRVADRSLGVGHGASLTSPDGSVVYIQSTESANAEQARQMYEASRDAESNVFDENEDMDAQVFGSYSVTSEFYKFISELAPHEFARLANGSFKQMIQDSLDYNQD